MSELSPTRWAYLQQLHPSRDKYLHVSCRIVRHPNALLHERLNKVYMGPQYLVAPGTTYNVGRNKAKRAKRAAAKEKQLAVGKATEMFAQAHDRMRAYDRLNVHSKCWCERNHVGVDGFSCGDCPRDYEKALQRGQCN